MSLGKTDDATKPEQKYRCILIFGPPGAGKGTVGSVISKAGNMFHLSSGDIFRGLSHDSPAGQLAHGYLKQGRLVPDDATIRIWSYYVSDMIKEGRYVPEQQYLLLDGIPRTDTQAAILDDYIEVQHIVQLEVDDEEELLTRLRRRAQIEGREDDVNDEILMTRLRVYEEQTASVLKHYDPSLVTKVNANQLPLVVLRDLLNSCAEDLSCQARPVLAKPKS